MILCDTGIIVAAISRSDSNHKSAIGALATVRPPVMTTWPCLTEAMYLLGQHGSVVQGKLQKQVESGVFALQSPTYENATRAFELMRRHADAPMDFADASLVVAAEVLHIARILTFDQHFYAYRIDDHTAFEVLP